MTIKFLDTNSDKIITVEELQAEFEELCANGGTDAKSLKQYIRNCLTLHNGTLEVIE